MVILVEIVLQSKYPRAKNNDQFFGCVDVLLPVIKGIRIIKKINACLTEDCHVSNAHQRQNLISVYLDTVN